MVYKNFILRFLSSILLFFVYFISLNYLSTLFIFGLLLYLIILFEVYKFFNKNTFLIIFYLIISFINFYIYVFNYFEFRIFNLLILVIIIFDTFSYLVGKFLGKTLLLKKISPKKTFEGFFGGIFFTNLFYLILILFSYESFDLKMFVLIHLIIFFALFGDLFQSFFKRKNNIKDSSNYLPGHGGFFDRFDSFISSIIILNIFTFFYS